jgi:CheY-like chemotaxis protein
MDILIAEDDRVSRLVLQETLTNLGHVVAAMDDGAKARAALTGSYFPLVISDWIMPGCDGLELCRLVRSGLWDKYTYVMLLTSVGGKENFLAAMKAGIDDFVAKPLDREQLAARIRVAERILGLQSAVKKLEGLIPICSYCKCVRGDSDYWQQVEAYIATRTDAVFSHGICPKCYEQHVQPQLDALSRQREPGEAAA